MFKNYLFTIYLVLITCISGNLSAQSMDGTDSALVKKYWNRVNIQSITSKGNNLYNGIDNYFQLIYPDRQSSTFQYYITTNNGQVYEYDETSYLTLPRTLGWSFISIHIVTEDGDTLLIGKKRFPVISLPYPTLIIGKTLITENAEVDKKVFLNGDSLKVHFTEDIPESKDWYKIEYFSIGYTYGKIYVSADNTGPVFRDEAKTLLNKVKPGYEINIKVHTVSPSGLLKNMPLVKFKMY